MKFMTAMIGVSTWTGVASGYYTPDPTARDPTFEHMRKVTGYDGPSEDELLQFKHELEDEQHRFVSDFLRRCHNGVNSCEQVVADTGHWDEYVKQAPPPESRNDLHGFDAIKYEVADCTERKLNCLIFAFKQLGDKLGDMTRIEHEKEEFKTQIRGRWKEFHHLDEELRHHWKKYDEYNNNGGNHDHHDDHYDDHQSHHDDVGTHGGTHEDHDNHYGDHQPHHDDGGTRHEPHHVNEHPYDGDHETQADYGGTHHEPHHVNEHRYDGDHETQTDNEFHDEEYYNEQNHGEEHEQNNGEEYPKEPHSDDMKTHTWEKNFNNEHQDWDEHNEHQEPVGCSKEIGICFRKLAYHGLLDIFHKRIISKDIHPEGDSCKLEVEICESILKEWN